jgi:ubiquinone biosynthesis protein COQ4
MMAHPTGKRILIEKPRVTPETFKIEELLKLNENTFG